MADSAITKNALANSLKELMREKGFEKVSVSEICERCGMNRKSFYYHFRDKYDLVNWIFYSDFLGRLSVAKYETDWDLMADMCDRFYEDRDFYLEALKIEGQNSFKEYVSEIIRPLVAFFIKDVFREKDEEEFFLTFVIDAFLNSIMKWLQNGMQISPADFVAKLRGVSTRLAYRIVNEAKVGELSDPE